MKKTQVILHHIGLGDQLMLNGMVRYFVEKKFRVVLVAKEQQRESIEFMYRDLKIGLYHHDVIVYYVKREEEGPKSIMKKLENEDTSTMIRLATYSVPDQIWLHLMSHPQFDNLTNWSNGVYMQAGVNPYFMRDKFHVDRDSEREDKMFKHFGLIEGEYVFVHDAPNRKQGDGTRKIDIDNKLKIFNPNDTYEQFPNLFDYISIIEKAKEVHCMNSSYAWLIDLLKLGNKETNFLHIDAAHNYYTRQGVKTSFNEDVWNYV